ncbi:MAG: glucosaminidase domain-containing protein [Bacteroidales bacterium]|nr:glucosaminidase domain-containing protein [Bacteroidales bacterium]
MHTTTKFSIPIFLILLFVAVSDSVWAQTNRRTVEYIKKYKDIAIRSMKKYKIPASITLAQAILESGSGDGRLARKANNHFGIKCHSDWRGKTFHMNDDARHECFRKYSNPEASFADHSKFLTTKGRYSFLFKYPITDYKKWAYGLKRAGYATNPRYPQLLISLIERYQLYRYDKAIPKRWWQKEKTTDIQYSEPDTDQFVTAGTNPNGRPYYLNNGKKLVIIKSGDTFKKLAFDFEIPVHKLVHFNDVKRSFVLHPGDLIYLQKKARKAERPYFYHVVKEGETLWQIAQLYGIRLKVLRNKNNLPRVYQPVTGTRLKLR